MLKKLVIPKIVEVEIARGFCTASCPMCSIDKTKYNKIIMSDEKFIRLVDNFGSNIQNFDKWILCGLGEVLLDKKIDNKIKYVKSKGVPYVSAPSNASLLNKKIAKKILDAGLDEIIIGIHFCASI